MKRTIAFTIIFAISLVVTLYSLLSPNPIILLNYYSLGLSALSVFVAFLTQEEKHSSVNQEDEYLTTKSTIKSVFPDTDFVLPFIIHEEDCYFLLIMVAEDKGETLITFRSEDTILYKKLNENETPYMEENETNFLFYLPKSVKIQDLNNL